MVTELTGRGDAEVRGYLKAVLESYAGADRVEQVRG